jgi:hypothetical protein
VTANLCFLPAGAAYATTTATEFLPDLAKGRAAFRKIGVIGTRQERAEVFSRDADTPGMQLVGGLSHLYPCSVSPCGCLNLPVIREAPSNRVAKLGEISIDHRIVMIRPLDYLTNGRRRVLIQRCLKRLQDRDGFHSA